MSIEKKAVTVTANAQTIIEGGSIETGTEQAVLTDMAEGHVLSVITLSVDTDQSVITPGNAVIADVSGTDVTGNYTIQYETGTLTIRKAITAEVTFKVANGSWDDGFAADKVVTLKGMKAMS